MTRWRSWRTATTGALYGETGFFRTQAPADHFRTSVHASTSFAAAVLRSAEAGELRTIVDIGAGRGELLTALHTMDPELSLVGVELADRPAGLHNDIQWVDEIPEGVHGLTVANEWLDNVPVDLVELDSTGVPRIVLVDSESGDERLGDPIDEVDRSDAAWLREWWPLDHARPGDRAEIGRPRDEAWAAVVRRLGSGVLLAVDYGHLADDRPYGGTLTGYRAGQQVRPVPDGRCDLTAHVAIDAVEAAGTQAGAAGSDVTTQREALRALGISAARPELELARTNPAAYLRALSRTGEHAELLAPGGLGDFWWLRQTKAPGNA